MTRLPALATKDRAALRLILACYAQQRPAVAKLVYQRLETHTWAPTPEDCPGGWPALEQWYNGLERTGQIVMDSY